MKKYIYIYMRLVYLKHKLVARMHEILKCIYFVLTQLCPFLDASKHWVTSNFIVVNEKL